MSEAHLFLAFLAAALVLMLIPGPNVALITANSLAYGPVYGLTTVAGTTAAIVIQLFLTSLGMTTLMAHLAFWFTWLRWLGVAYLVYLGLSQWLAKPVDLAATRPLPKSLREIYTRGFLVSLVNPKTLFFFGAFFPQFIDPAAPVTFQVVRLCVTFLLMAIVIDSGWALLAVSARGLLLGRVGLLQRLTGTLLLSAGLGLALARLR